MDSARSEMLCMRSQKGISLGSLFISYFYSQAGLSCGKGDKEIRSRWVSLLVAYKSQKEFMNEFSVRSAEL